MTRESPRSTVIAAIRVAFGRIGRTLAHTSPVRLLLLICVTIAFTHSLTMWSLHAWHAVLPDWAHSLVESALLVLALFPTLYFLSFRPLFAQIAERERAEATMWQSEHKYRCLFNSLGDAAFLIDVDRSRIIDANAQAERLLVRRRSEIVGADKNLLFPPERAEAWESWLRRRSQDQIDSFEAEVLTADGRLVPVHASAAPLSLFGRDLVVALCRDVTDYKTLHAELLRAQRLESVGALASGIAHDLNNALTPVLFASELLRMQPLDGNSSRLLGTISASATRASQVVRQMLTFVRGGEQRRAAVPLVPLVREAVEMARVAFPKSIDIRQQVPDALWTVEADPAQLSQVLMNLAVNARDAMPEGGELTFAAENVAIVDAGPQGLPSGSYVVLSVADTGSGIPEEIRDRIFDPFFTTKPAGKGTGLGLATARDIVAAHGGAIQVDSHPGQGTTFRIFLPARLATATPPPAPKPSIAPRGNGELVLVADDEAAVLEMVRLALESAGYRVLPARDGTEAVVLGAEAKETLRLAIIDTGMPFLGGAATQRALHRILPTLKIIAMSGEVAAAGRSGPENAGGHAFLQKPFSAEQLLSAVHDALESRVGKDGA